MHRYVATLITLLLVAPAAHADSGAADRPALTRAADAPRHSFGFRVGGYGFRNLQPGQEGEWNDCRMNGVGVFGQRNLSDHFFAEAALDMYFVDNTILGDDGPEYPLDRESGLLSVAGGARMFPGYRVSPYVQVGIGLELTRAILPAEDEQHVGVYPMGFAGVGADVRVSDRFALGANFRTNVMRHFDVTYTLVSDPESDDWGSFDPNAVPPGENTLDDQSYAFAAQAQFFARYSF